ncbi:MAG: ABC transporter permease [Actinomycetota bacterium]
MIPYVIARLLWAAITLVLVVTVVFVIFFVVPGGGGRRESRGISPVAVLLAGRRAQVPEMREIEQRLKLDRPVPVQYLNYVSNLARGNLGYSFAANAPVSSIVLPAVGPSLSIALGASGLWVLAGAVVGTVSANRRGSTTDRALMGLSLAALSLPVFFVALMALSAILNTTGIYAGNRYVPLSQGPLEWLEAMWLPWICLALPLVAVYARMIRSRVLEVKAEDYIRTSVAKGLSRSGVIRHELRGSLTPIVTMYGLDLSLLAGGSVIIERIFRIPGLGSLLLDARDFYDFPVMAGVVLLFSVMIIVINLAVDVLYCSIDPRVRVSTPGVSSGRA